jgi:hypothetical protein
MTCRDQFFAIIALVLSAAALTGMVHVDAYTQAAQAEASAYAVLTRHLSDDDLLRHGSDRALPHPASQMAAPQH